jgi:hypothetical protein
MTKTITKICNNIWITGKWPEDWKSSVFIPLFKKGDMKECENYRTIAMISHISKILLKIIHKRMENIIERESFLIAKQDLGNLVEHVIILPI